MKMKSGSKLFLSALISFTLSFISLFAVTGFVLYSSWKTTLDEVQKVMRNRTVETGIAMASIASTQFTDAGYVNLSALMFDVERNARSRGYRIEKAFLLDRNGVVRAHNDATQIAKENQQNYKTDEYLSFGRLPKASPWKVTVANTPAAPSEPFSFNQSLTRLGAFFNSSDARINDFKGMIQSIFKDRTAVKYHYGFAIYPLDSENALGAVHLMVNADLLNEVIESFYYMTLWALPFSLAGTLILTLVSTILVSLMGSKKTADVNLASAGPQMKTIPMTGNEVEADVVEILEDIPELQMGRPGSPGQILDAIPLNRQR